MSSLGSPADAACKSGAPVARQERIQRTTAASQHCHTLWHLRLELFESRGQSLLQPLLRLALLRVAWRECKWGR